MERERDMKGGIDKLSEEKEKALDLVAKYSTGVVPRKMRIEKIYREACCGICRKSGGMMKVEDVSSNLVLSGPEE
jgi:hypothetical protein